MDRYDAVIVGGSFAGLSAAIQLARARRRILLVDAGRPRNRFAAASHGFLGQDGVAPAEIMRQGLTQLARYPTVDFVHAEALSASHADAGFVLTLSDGSEARGRKLILATGVADESVVEAISLWLSSARTSRARSGCRAPTPAPPRAMRSAARPWRA